MTISFGVRKLSSPEVHRILAVAGRQQDEDPAFPLYSFEFAAGAAELGELRALLVEHGIKYSERLDHRFTDREIETAPLVYPVLRRAESGMGGPTYGTEFDLSDACLSCGTGAKQVGSLKLKKSEIPRTGQTFHTLDGEWLFAEEAAQRLCAFTGVELRQAVDAVSEQPLPWFQLLATHQLPPMHRATTGLKPTVGCKHCRRDGYFHTAKEPLLIAYDASEVDLEHIPDVAVTLECFGWSRLTKPFQDSHFAQPLIVAKPYVVKSLREARVRLLQHYPVTLV